MWATFQTINARLKPINLVNELFICNKILIQRKKQRSAFINKTKQQRNESWSPSEIHHRAPRVETRAWWIASINPSTTQITDRVSIAHNLSKSPPLRTLFPFPRRNNPQASFIPRTYGVQLTQPTYQQDWSSSVCNLLQIRRDYKTRHYTQNFEPDSTKTSSLI